jgi:hypothetical protein
MPGKVPSSWYPALERTKTERMADKYNTYFLFLITQKYCCLSPLAIVAAEIRQTY